MSFDDRVCPDMDAETVQEALAVLCQRPSGGHEPYLVLRYVGGDGQEGRPSETLPCTLAVGVEDENGRPQAGVTVTFTADDDDDILIDVSDGLIARQEIDWPTNDNGIAEVRWVLGRNAHGCHRVVAQLEDTPSQGSALEVHFKATVREEHEAPADWPQVVETNWANDRPLPLGLFNGGLRTTFSEPMHPSTASLDTFIVTLELPTLEPPLLEQIYSERGLDGLKEEFEAGEGYPGHRIFIVFGEVIGDGTSWTFKPHSVGDNPGIPGNVLRTWLDREREFFDVENPQTRCRVVLKGNAILDANGERPLDGDVFGRHEQDGDYIDLILPSGDGVKGGDFESWFYLVLDEGYGELPPGQPGWPDPPDSNEIERIRAEVRAQPTDERTVEYRFFVLAHWVRDLARQGHDVERVFPPSQAKEIDQALQRGDKGQAAKRVNEAYQALEALVARTPA